MTQRICSIEACEHPAHGRGWCRAHYKRWRTHGDVRADVPLGVSRRVLDAMSAEERFWVKVDKQVGGCWIWTATCSTNGYGQFWSEDRVNVPAHRQAYEFEVGTIPSGMVLDHLCRIKSCVNPDHLEVVTQSENVLRGLASRGQGDTCRAGHPRTPDNTHVRKSGERYCMTCKNERDRDRYSRRKSNAA